MNEGVIALYNAKGGTGKTTVAINLGGALNVMDRNVVIVDLDPQGNATEALGKSDHYDDSSPTLYDLITGEEPAERINEIVCEHGEVDLVPGNVDMLYAERSLAVQVARGDNFCTPMDDLVDALSERYDYVVMDLPPFFGALSDLALVSAGNMIIPSLAESTSQRAVELMLDQRARLNLKYEQSIREIAAVANRIEQTNEAKKMRKWFRTVFDDVPLFFVRKRVAFQRAYNEGISLFEYDPNCDMRLPFKNLGRTVLESFESGR